MTPLDGPAGQHLGVLASRERPKPTREKLNETQTFTTTLAGLSPADHITGESETARADVAQQWADHLSQRSAFQHRLDGLQTTDPAIADVDGIDNLPAEMLRLAQAEVAVREAAEAYLRGPAREATASLQASRAEELRKAESEALATLQDSGFTGRLLERTAREHESVVSANAAKRSADGFAGSLNQHAKENATAIDQLRGQARKLIDRLVGRATPGLQSLSSRTPKPASNKSVVG